MTQFKPESHSVPRGKNRPLSNRLQTKITIYEENLKEQMEN